MKTRYNILAVIISFVVFYFALIPALHICLESDSDCSTYRELVILTRPVVTVDVWDDGISQYSGTVEGMEEANVDDTLRMNQNFILTMIVTPSVIITGIILWDKRKLNTKPQKN